MMNYTHIHEVILGKLNTFTLQYSVCCLCMYVAAAELPRLSHNHAKYIPLLHYI